MGKGLKLAALFGTVAVLAGCGGGGSSGESGGTFRIGTSSRIDSLNPYVAFNQDAYSAFQYIYPFLIQYDQTNEQFVPDFATLVEVERRRQDVDVQTSSEREVVATGKPMTAEDAAWTINTDIKYRPLEPRERGRA